nr:uncharacterized protein LOC117443262 isoform X2 [Pseudochaenichthys georgianus]
METEAHSFDLSALRNETKVLETRLTEAGSRMMKIQTESSVLSVQLSLMESRLTDRYNGTSELEVRLGVGEKQLEDLKTENTVQSVQRSLIGSRLTDIYTNTTELGLRLGVSEKQLEDRKIENTVHSGQLFYIKNKLIDDHYKSTALEGRLRSTETKLRQLENHTAVELSGLNLRLNVNEGQVEELRTHNTDRLSAAVMETEAHSFDLSALRNETKVLEIRLTEAGSRMMKIQTESSVLSVQLSLMESRLTDRYNGTSELEVRLGVGEKQLEDLKTENTGLEVRLSVNEKLLEDLKTENTDFSFRLNETDDSLHQLRNTNSGELKVAFSAGLTDSGSVGPFNEERTLIFSKTITNIGQAYNQTAGVFTAPVRGLYFFSFTAADYLKGYMGLYLYKNDRPIIFNLELNDHGGYASTSNGIALQLDEGDIVRLSLPASYRLYDDSRNFSIFSGFLLFPL